MIDKATETRFKAELSEVEEKVMFYWTEKDGQDIFSGVTHSAKEKLPVSNKAEESDFSDHLIAEIKEIKGVDDLDDATLYYINKGNGEGQISYTSSHRYIIDIDTLQVYDFDGDKFKGKWHHTLNGLGVDGTDPVDEKTPGEDNPDKPISDLGAEVCMDGDIGWLKPNLNGFNRNYTDVVYYNKDNNDDTKIVSIQNYINDGRKSKIQENGKTYVLDGYKDKMWANVKTRANNLETWWVWIPRYAYRVVNSNPQASDADMPIDVVFIDMQNQPIGSKYAGKYTVNNDGTITINGEEYIIHPSFKKEDTRGNTVELQGIWMSKFEPSSNNNSGHIMDTGECYAPDMTGFDKDFTWIELYDSTANEGLGDFTSEVQLSKADLSTVNNDKKWYDYSNKIWANIKTEANGIECWWVWIPRYAYTISEANQETEVVFVDTKDRPYDKSVYGDTLPEGMTVHPCFTKVDKNGKRVQLKGIWMSKYEPSSLDNSGVTQNSGDCLAPDMTGFDANNTWIELYDKTANNGLGDFIDDTNYKLSNVDLNTINNNKQWYDYSDKIWANVKTKANELECWWVWIPRYAYHISEGNQETDVIFVDLDNKPCNTSRYGKKLPDGFTVHPCFTKVDENGNTVQLKGIWMSKFEPSYVDGAIDNTENSRATAKITNYNTDPNGNIITETMVSTDFSRTPDDGHTHNKLGYGIKRVKVSNSAHWCDGWNGNNGNCNGYGFYAYCTECGARWKFYWCDTHMNRNGRQPVNDLDTTEVQYIPIR